MGLPGWRYPEPIIGGRQVRITGRGSRLEQAMAAVPARAAWAWVRRRQLWLWLTPVVVAVAAAKLSERQLEEVIGAILALGLFAVMVRRPGAALLALVAFLPLEQISFGLLLGLHVPASLLEPASGFKELMGISILFAALRELRDGRERLDRLDRALLAYVGFVTLYLLLPHLFSPTAPSAWNVRLLAWRSDCGYPLVFFGVRHAGISFRFRERFTRLVIGLGVLTAVLALYQRAAPGSWTNFVFHRAHQVQFETDIVHVSLADTINTFRYLLSLNPLRVSSIFFSPFDMADYLVLVAALLVERISHDARSPWRYPQLALVMAALFFSRTRADALAAVIVLALAVLPAPRRPIEARVRLIVALLVGAAIVVPALGGTRFLGAHGANTSSQQHVSEVTYGISVIWHHPFGLGLGDQPSTASRFAAATGQASGVISDNSVTQVGDELGI
ncbi:MAG: hypothetical protein ACYC1D_08780, partial [Acidimicrobiales bacterium]